MLQQKANASAVQNTQPGLAGVEADLNFIVPDGRKPFTHQYDPPPGQPVRSHPYENRKVFIQDGRAHTDAFSIDREGFALVPHVTKVADLYDEESLKTASRGRPTPRGWLCEVRIVWSKITIFEAPVSALSSASVSG